MPDTTSTDTTTAAPDLLASTGLNDPTSPWNINGLLQTGINFGTSELQAALQQQTPLSVSANGTPASQGGPAPGAPSAAKALMPASKWGTYILWIAALALVGWVFLEWR